MFFAEFAMGYAVKKAHYKNNPAVNTARETADR